MGDEALQAMTADRDKWRAIARKNEYRFRSLVQLVQSSPSRAELQRKFEVWRQADQQAVKARKEEAHHDR
jgi:cupin superfamily acireductone dioxygenase involved in methionine salvage